MRTLVPGTLWPAVDDRIAPRAGEPVLVQLFASAFFGTPLAAMLAAHSASTSGCVRATVVDALQHGYRVVVPREGVADRAAGPHAAALFDIDTKYGDAVELDAAEALLRGAG